VKLDSRLNVWRTVPRENEISNLAGRRDTINKPFDVILPYDASSGKAAYPNRLRDQRRTAATHFSIYRTIDIGVDDVTIEVTTRIPRKTATWEVGQRLVNESDENGQF